MSPKSYLNHININYITFKYNLDWTEIIDKINYDNTPDLNYEYSLEYGLKTVLTHLNNFNIDNIKILKSKNDVHKEYETRR